MSFCGLKKGISLKLFMVLLNLLCECYIGKGQLDSSRFLPPDSLLLVPVPFLHGLRSLYIRGKATSVDGALRALRAKRPLLMGH